MDINQACDRPTNTVAPAANGISTCNSRSISKADARPSIRSDEADREPAPEKPLSCRSFEPLNLEHNFQILICYSLRERLMIKSASLTSKNDLIIEWLPFFMNRIDKENLGKIKRERFVSSQKVLANDSSIILEDMHSNDDVRWFFIFTSTF